MSDHELLVCEGDPGDEAGQNETPSTCPPERPVCQSTGGVGACVSLEPLLCMEQLVAMTTATRLDVADIDGDGLDDIVFAESTAILAARGAPDGSFGVPVAVADGPMADGIARHDGDGIPDLWRRESSGGLSFAPGTGHGTFGAWQAVPAISGYVLVVVDLDGDGRDDVVDQVSHPDLSFEILLHANAAAFATTAVRRFLPGDLMPDAVAFPLRSGAPAGDDQRSVIGLAYTTSTDLYLASDFSGAALATVIGAPSHPADYNRDGFTDVVMGNAVALGDGAGHFAASAARAVGQDALYDGDFDGDGIIDFKQIGFTSGGGFTPTVTLRGKGDGTFVEGKSAYDQRGVVSAAPIRRAKGPGADLAIVDRVDDGTNEIRILRGSCP